MTSRICLVCTITLVATAATRAADPPPEWSQFLKTDSVFGDYEGTKAAWALKARPLVDASAAGASPDRERALWVGINLEYQAWRSASDQATRAKHARPALEWAVRLQTLLREADPANADSSSWQSALPLLAVMQREMEGPSPPAPSLPVQARLFVLRNITTDPKEDVAAQKPILELMTTVSGRFRELQRLAALASAVNVQASAALGVIYGYPPNIEDWKAGPPPLRDNAKTLSPPERKAFFEPASWDRVFQVLSVTAAETSVVGIAGAVENVKLALMADGNTTVLDGQASTVRALYKLDSLMTLVQDGTIGLRELANKTRPEGAGLPEITSPSFQKPGQPTEPDYGNVRAYLNVYGEKFVRRSRASLELEKLTSEVRKRTSPIRLMPLEETTYKNLVQITALVLDAHFPAASWNESRADELVQKWIFEWLDRNCPLATP